MARLGKDSTRIVVWNGLKAVHFEKMVKQDTQQVAERVKQLEIEHSVKRRNVVIDQDGIGG